MLERSEACHAAYGDGEVDSNGVSASQRSLRAEAKVRPLDSRLREEFGEEAEVVREAKRLAWDIGGWICEMVEGRRGVEGGEEEGGLDYE